MKIRRADLTDARDSAAIDDFVAQHPQAQLFHRPHWSRAVAKGCGAKAHYLVAENGSLCGLLPLSEVRSPLFGNSMVSAGFGVGGGILAEDSETAQALADAAWTLAGERGCTGLELRGGAVPEGPWQLNDSVYANFSADLPQGDEAILLSIKKRQRAEVRRAQTFDLNFTEGTGAAELDAHYRTYGASVRNLGTPVFPRRLFEAMASEFGDDAHILTAWKDGKPLSSVFSFFFKGSAAPYWGGGTAEARQWRANEATYYELMCRAARRGCTRFDFGRSKVGSGPYAFKKNWGFEPEPLVYATRTADGAAQRQINPMSPKYRLQVATWKRMPLWLANVLGPPIAKGLG
ncbi:MAG TPA: FemAB family XrtA/PEP-CTERM system-associated protein [Allosphingosinicella sp.]|nr:FemAB family XrtA/PEP-CTERM system-associated protein [Allosphingosinicella sp.]